MRHPQAVLDRIYDKSKHPFGWRPKATYRIVMVRRDGTKDYSGWRTEDIKEARAEIQRRFDNDKEDVYDGAWIHEEVRC